eukprot:XP_015575484.1 uncharacterized protein LOC107261360 [Ricinus communis]
MSYFLGMEIKQTDGGIFAYQHKYAKEILKKSLRENSKAVTTPIMKGAKLCKSDEHEAADERKYRSLVGCLLYLTATRPDILFAISMLSRFMHCASNLHYQTAKRVLRYVEGTAKYGVVFLAGNKAQLNLEGFCDSGWA